jgi:hypothetical protein
MAFGSFGSLDSASFSQEANRSKGSALSVKSLVVNGAFAIVFFLVLREIADCCVERKQRCCVA